MILIGTSAHTCPKQFEAIEIPSQYQQDMSSEGHI
jgi:hypothetical protein